jgi:hypothetical protein
MYADRQVSDSEVVRSELALGRGRRPLANGPATLGPRPVAPLRPVRFMFSAGDECASRWSRDFALLFAAGPNQGCR